MVLTLSGTQPALFTLSPTNHSLPIHLLLSPLVFHGEFLHSTRGIFLCIQRLIANHVQSVSHDVTAAMLVFQNKEMAAMMVYQTSPPGIELYFYSNTIFTGLPYGNPSRKMGRFLRFIFRVGKSLACHSPAKWCLCA